MIPLSIFLQLATRRPVAFLGQYSLRRGSIRRQSSSGTSQIVGSGLVRGLRRVMVTAPLRGSVANRLDTTYFKQRAFPPFSDSF
jgi:hypothetical protein